MVFIIEENLFSSKGVFVIFYVFALFTPNTIATDWNLQPLSKQTWILGHIYYHEFVVFTVCLSKIEVVTFPFDFEVKPLTIWLCVVIKPYCKKIKGRIILSTFFVSIEDLLIAFHANIQVRWLELIWKLEMLILIDCFGIIVLLDVLGDGLVKSIWSDSKVSIILQVMYLPIFDLLCS